jgi:GNAT superfamily N-acetyltransferase
MDLDVTPLPADDPLAFARVGRIYECAFPESERKPTADVLALSGRPDYRVDVARLGEAVAGFAVWFLPPDEPFALLEYLAVDERHRGRGLGAALVRNGTGVGRTVIAEVDAEDAACPERARRVAFYRRLGFGRVAGLAYLLPLRTAGLPPAMGLMVWRPDGAPPLRRAVLARWLGVIYERVYGQAAGDPRVEGMVRGVGDLVEVE